MVSIRRLGGRDRRTGTAAPYRMPRSFTVAIGANGAALGIISLTYPLLLNALDATKLEVVLLFVIDACVVVAANLGGVPEWSSRDRRGALATQVVAAAGLLTAAGSSFLLQLYAGAAMSMGLTVLFPCILGALSTGDVRPSKSYVVSMLRRCFTAGFLTGTAVVGLTGLTGRSHGVRTAVAVAGGLAVVSAVATWFGMTRVKSPATRSGDATANGMPPRRPSSQRVSRGVALGLLAAVILLKAADSLRGVYLPLYAAKSGISVSVISGLFLVTGVGEILILPFLARLTETAGARTALIGVAGIGAAVFAVIVFGGRSYWTLFGSQALYAVYAAGYQMMGVVVLGEAIGGLLRGAAVYTAVMQCGALTGIFLPLAVPGYSSALFVGALVCCCLAGGALWTARVAASRGYAKAAAGLTVTDG